MPKLILNPKSSRRTEHDLPDQAQISVGRGEHNDVVLPWRMASRDHAIIEHRDGKYLIFDRDSYNGTYVNGRLIQHSELNHGDEIRIASATFRFLIDDELDPEATLNLSRAPRPRDEDDTDPLMSALEDESPAHVDAGAQDELNPHDLSVGDLVNRTAGLPLATSEKGSAPGLTQSAPPAAGPGTRRKRSGVDKRIVFVIVASITGLALLMIAKLASATEPATLNLSPVHQTETSRQR